MIKVAEKSATKHRLKGSAGGDLSDYIRADMRKAKYECDVEDRIFNGTTPSCRGVIGTGNTLEVCREDLHELLEEWMVWGFRLGHDLLVIDGIDPNYSREATLDA